MFVIAIVISNLLFVSSTVNFLAVGDWGGIEVAPFYTPGQIAAAAGMQTIAASIQSDFVLAVGDNFYSAGISSDENSGRFQATFEAVYTGSNLQTPWYVAPGNHDYKGNVTAQIEYSKHSERWTFPDFYHSHHVQSKAGVTVDIIMIDTLSMASLPEVDEGHPRYFDPLPERPRSQAAAQWDWIEAEMAASKAQYLIVAGHYPVYSVCEHGPTSTLITNLKPLLEKYDAHYVAGHDHCLEHLQEPGSKVNYIVTGLGDTCCYKSSNLNSVPTDSLQWYVALSNARTIIGGFTSFTATASELTITYHDQNGDKLFAPAPVFPRNI